MYSIEHSHPVVTHFWAAHICVRARNQPLRPVVQPVEDFKQIRAEFLALIEEQVEALERDTFVGLTHLGRLEYDARHDRIQELHAKLGQFKTAA